MFRLRDGGGGAGGAWVGGGYGGDKKGSVPKMGLFGTRFKTSLFPSGSVSWLWVRGAQKHSEAGDGRPVDRGVWAAKTVKRPPATTTTTPNTPTTGRRYHANGTSRHIQHSPGTPTAGLRERGNDTRKSTGRSGRQNAATRRNMRRDERVTVQGPVKEQQPDGMSHRGGGPARSPPPPPAVGKHVPAAPPNPLPAAFVTTKNAFRRCTAQRTLTASVPPLRSPFASVSPGPSTPSATLFKAAWQRRL